MKRITRFVAFIVIAIFSASSVVVVHAAIIPEVMRTGGKVLCYYGVGQAKTAALVRYGSAAKWLTVTHPLTAALSASALIFSALTSNNEVEDRIGQIMPTVNSHDWYVQNGELGYVSTAYNLPDLEPSPWEYAGTLRILYQINLTTSEAQTYCGEIWNEYKAVYGYTKVSGGCVQSSTSWSNDAQTIWYAGWSFIYYPDAPAPSQKMTFVYNSGATQSNVWNKADGMNFQNDLTILAAGTGEQQVEAQDVMNAAYAEWAKQLDGSINGLKDVIGQLNDILTANITQAQLDEVWGDTSDIEDDVLQENTDYLEKARITDAIETALKSQGLTATQIEEIISTNTDKITTAMQENAGGASAEQIATEIMEGLQELDINAPPPDDYTLEVPEKDNWTNILTAFYDSIQNSALVTQIQGRNLVLTGGTSTFCMTNPLNQQSVCKDMSWIGPHLVTVGNILFACIALVYTMYIFRSGD